MGKPRGGPLQIVLALCSAVAFAGCPPDVTTAPHVQGSASTDVELTANQPVAVGDLSVELPPKPSRLLPQTVRLRCSDARIRVASVEDEEPQLPVFVTPLYAPTFELGTVGPEQLVLRRHILVEALDPGALPDKVTLTVEASTEEWPGASPVSDPTSVTVSWARAAAPAAVSAVRSGELPLRAGETATATLDVRFDPRSASDPGSLVPTWWIDATFVPTVDGTPSTANLVVRPGASGFNMTLFQPGWRTMYLPDTIRCSRDGGCALHYDLTLRGNEGVGTVRWQITAQLVDFTGASPPGRAVSVDVAGIPANAGPLDPPLGTG